MARRKSLSLERSFGLRLKAKRNVLGVSQEELADRSDLHRTYVSQLERGLKSPSLSTLYALASALKVDVTELVRDLQHPRSEGR
jgi:transcriptional regulator with XRE-family HTH domain